jgi:hypothetical protein
MRENVNNKVVKVVKILEDLIDLVKNEETDLAWSRFNTVDELFDELLDHINKLINKDFSKLGDLILLFAPTASLQEISISSGWGSQFLIISEEFDYAIAELRKEFNLNPKF